MVPRGVQDPVHLGGWAEMEKQTEPEVQGHEVVPDLFLVGIGDTVCGFDLYDYAVVDEYVRPVVANLDTLEKDNNRYFALYVDAALL
jgi:hypothetical protein